MSAIKRRRILGIIATDATFGRQDQRGEEVWVGKCIHCNRRLVVGLDGTPRSDATIEHILPRNHGGTDEIANLALACGPCNFEKGRRHDVKRRSDAKLDAVIQQLQAVRRGRWRDPDA